MTQLRSPFTFAEYLVKEAEALAWAAEEAQKPPEEMEWPESGDPYWYTYEGGWPTYPGTQQCTTHGANAVYNPALQMNFTGPMRVWCTICHSAERSVVIGFFADGDFQHPTYLA